MGNRLYDNEFEEFLKNQANQHRMYPSDQLWGKIQTEVHGYKKWPALPIIAVFIIAALVIGTVAVKPHRDLISSQEVAQSLSVKEQPSQTTASVNENDKVYADHLAVNNLTRQTIARVTESIQVTQSEELLIAAPAVTKTSIADNTAKQAPAGKNATGASEPANNNTSDALAKNNSAQKDKNTFLHDARFIYSTNFTLPVENSYQFTNTIYYNNDYSYSRNANSLLNFELAATKPALSSPLSKIGKNSSKFDFQFYVTPSVSYRRLVDDVEGSLSKSYITALPYSSNYVVDLSHAIQHRPAVGYEVGFNLGYSLGKKFALRSGLQFNMRQYNIDAFVHSAEPATVALSADNSNLVYNTVSAFRNVDGSKPIELKNRYYEIAVPIGIDWRPVNKKFVWGLGAAIQPTYTFDKEPFIITSNYKNYANGSSLMRNWNINANIETYFGYNTGKYRWQIGPQLRYQLMPTMANSFPIREYPVDLGLKIGLTRSLQ